MECTFDKTLGHAYTSLHKICLNSASAAATGQSTISPVSLPDWGRQNTDVASRRQLPSFAEDYKPAGSVPYRQCHVNYYTQWRAVTEFL